MVDMENKWRCPTSNEGACVIWSNSLSEKSSKEAKT